MKNNILWPVIATGLVLSSSIAQAQERVQWLVCTIAKSCNLERSSLSTSYRPFKDNFITDIPERLNINLQCVADNGLRSTATQILNGWQVSSYGAEKLLPYHLRHSNEWDSFSKWLWYNQDMNCYFWGIEFPKAE